MNQYESGTERTPLASLPLLTQLLVRMGHHWDVILATLVAVITGVALFFFGIGFFEWGRSLREAIVRNLPGIGRVYRISLVARFAQAAALGARAGQDLPTMLRLAAGATGSPGLVGDAADIARQIESGQSPVELGLRSRVLPGIVTFTLLVAGARGQLEAALGELARGYDDMARHRLAMLRVVLLPFSIIVAAVVIGLGIIALFLPLVSAINWLTGGGE